jgi:hypothetical protein
MTETGAPAAPPAQAAAGTRSANDFRREPNGPVGPIVAAAATTLRPYSEVKHMTPVAGRRDCPAFSAGCLCRHQRIAEALDGSSRRSPISCEDGKTRELTKEAK